MLQPSPVGFLALVAVAMCWALAVLLMRTGAPGSTARQLALLLAVESVTLISTGYIDLFISPAARAQGWYPGFVRFEAIVHTLGDCAMLALYPPFLASALQSRLTRPFADRRMRLGLGIAAISLAFATLYTPLEIGATLLYLGLSLLFAYALLASIQAWYAATGMARARAGSFVLAFGIRDVCWGFVYLAAIAMIHSEQYEIVGSDASSPTFIVYVLGTLLAVPLIAYGILRTHLFDIDLRIRWTIKQSTLAGLIVTLLYVISEGADRLLSAELGNWAGLLAAAIIVFFLAPLQRLAERVATVAMPNTQNTPEYLAFRKMQVYEAAFADAVREGGISQKERALLNTLRESLGISEADAGAIEAGCAGRTA